MKELKTILLYIVGVCAVIVVVGVLTNRNQGKPLFGSLELPLQTSTLQTYKKIRVGNVDLSVSVADDTEKRRVGLSETASLADNEGMLFVFDSQNTQPIFWMKDMEIDIDIIWINDGKITKIDEKVQAPLTGTQDKELPLYKSNTPVDYVLETAAGWTQKYNIKVGDEVAL